MEFLTNYKKSFEKKFISFIENLEINTDIKKSLKYSLFNGGKRLRPWIVSEISNSIENLDKYSIDHICYSLEILHTTSLIHDDMPEIDNANLRRGKKANHLVFGDYLSLLTGDYGFVLPLKIISNLNLSNLSIKNRLFSLFSNSTLRLIEGETEDVIFEKLGKTPSKEEIINMYKKKTGELFGLSFSIPFLLNGEKYIDDYFNSGVKFGIAFQIYDDLKDIHSTVEELGKNINTDENKQTLLNVLGPEEVKKYADSLFEEMGNFLLNKNLENFYNKLNSIKHYIEKK
jgi:geranylgeranyl pyrophosphate synthase